MAGEIAERTEGAFVRDLRPEPQPQPRHAQAVSSAGEQCVVHAIGQAHRRVGQGLEAIHPGQVLQPQAACPLPESPDEARHHGAADIRLRGVKHPGNLAEPGVRRASQLRLRATEGPGSGDDT